MEYVEWVYHGRQERGSSAQISVEEPAAGPSERATVRVLGEVPPRPGHGGLGWGYRGSGPYEAALVLLSHALAADPANVDVDKEFVRAFLKAFLAQACDEWRFTRLLIVTWAHAWHEHQDVPADLRPGLLCSLWVGLRASKA